MKKLTIALLLVIAINLAAKAQAPEKSPEKRAAHFTKVLSKALNLTAEQATKIDAIFLTRATEMDSLKSSAPGNKKGSHLNKEKIALTADEQVMGVLNSDQQKQYLQWEQEQKEKKKDKKSMADPGKDNPAPAQG